MLGIRAHELSLTRHEDRLRCTAASSSRRSAAPTPSCTWRATTCGWSRNSPACTTCRSTSRALCMSGPRSLYGFDRDGRSAVRAGEPERGAHRSRRRRPSLRGPRRDAWALRPLTMTWNDGGAYALLGPSGCGKTTLLNIISGLIAPTHGKVSVRRPRRHRARARSAQHRAGVPVPRHLRHDDGVRQPRLPAAQPRLERCAAASARGRSRRDPRAARRSRTARARPVGGRRSRRSRSAAAWCGPTSRRCCSTSR